MDKKEILRRIDHTALSPCTSWEDIKKLCTEALEHQTASVCVPPSYVGGISENFPAELVICTVIGFPLGYQGTETKILEARNAIIDGASEIDMVINIGDVKNKDFNKITQEIKSIKKVLGKNILKVIIETCYLDEYEKIRLCACVSEGGANFIKTSTGFGTAGANLADIALFKEHLDTAVKIKAAGGIKTVKEMEAFILAGCARIGSSSGVKLLTGE